MIYNETTKKAIIIILAMLLPQIGLAYNLYDEFNNRLEEISNYAENKIRKGTTKTVNEIYDRNVRQLEHDLAEVRGHQIYPHGMAMANNDDKLSGIATKMGPSLSPLKSDEVLARTWLDDPTPMVVDDGDPSSQDDQLHRQTISWDAEKFSRQRADSQLPSSSSPHTLASSSIPFDSHVMMYDSNDSDQFALSKKLPRKLKNYYPKRMRKRFRNFQSAADIQNGLLCGGGSCRRRAPRNLVKRLDVYGGSAYPDVIAKMPSANGATEQLVAVAEKLRQAQNVLNSQDEMKKLLQRNEKVVVGVSGDVGNDVNNRFPKQSPQIGAQSLAPSLVPGCGQCGAAPLPISVPMAAAGPCRAGGGVANLEPDGAQNLSSVLEKVLIELENLKTAKTTNSSQRPEGAPCDITGSWNSEAIGLQFDIAAPTEAKPGFNVELQDRNPLKRHTLMDCDWICGGAALKKIGGPFYISAQKPEESSLATFAGLCKTCGGIDMIFGSWTFVYPAKDCQDVAMSIETKRDVFRRSDLEKKRKERLEKYAKRSDKAKDKCKRCRN